MRCYSGWAIRVVINIMYYNFIKLISILGFGGFGFSPGSSELGQKAEH